MHLDTLQNWRVFRNRFEPKPSIRTAKRKVELGLWPGFWDGEDVWIYIVRFELGMKSPSKNEALAEQLLYG